MKRDKEEIKKLNETGFYRLLYEIGKYVSDERYRQAVLDVIEMDFADIGAEALKNILEMFEEASKHSMKNAKPISIRALKIYQKLYEWMRRTGVILFPARILLPKSRNSEYRPYTFYMPARDVLGKEGIFKLFFFEKIQDIVNRGIESVEIRNRLNLEMEYGIIDFEWNVSSFAEFVNTICRYKDRARDYVAKIHFSPR